MSDTNYFSYNINIEEGCVEISESGETMKLDFEYWKDFVSTILEADLAFMKSGVDT